LPASVKIDGVPGTGLTAVARLVSLSRCVLAFPGHRIMVGSKGVHI